MALMRFLLLEYFFLSMLVYHMFLWKSNRYINDDTLNSTDSVNVERRTFIISHCLAYWISPPTVRSRQRKRFRRTPSQTEHACSHQEQTRKRIMRRTRKPLYSWAEGKYAHSYTQTSYNCTGLNDLLIPAFSWPCQRRRIASACDTNTKHVCVQKGSTEITKRWNRKKYIFVRYWFVCAKEKCEFRVFFSCVLAMAVQCHRSSKRLALAMTAVLFADDLSVYRFHIL